ncbi:helix-turn-helix domain-containing protein [Clostridium tertium]|uniref:helix-turn-helix domain-containing protein n=1 Tax=Clostridium tertium TaxID=1559 RepID=UPI00232CFDEE|nr:helix-turn-helix domain-containing protein [Clostridium tertium]MDB1956622.1 helix-turn-helix domain-containing protein [Clostridium tertium]MDB1958493.1 helix-turn-helix domain-containing protein [Clostridium tertium]MDB1962384.1 helix-turn-helix domain-containing protein [Clostridium tertium]MDB1967674.1 helix-turn-helix domain-containing protein [Clostridium tertium]
MSLGSKIKKLRKIKKMTQSELADIIGVKTITIRKYESDEREPKFEIIEKLADALDVDVFSLLAANMDLYEDSHGNLISYDPSSINCPNIEDLDEEQLQYLNDSGYMENYKLKQGMVLDINKKCIMEKGKRTLLPIPFDEMKSKVDKMFPALQPEVDFLSNPNIEMVFNYSYNDLAKKGYDELLISAIEKAIRTTLEDIEKHLNNGDLFDGVGSWISKDSPLYEVIKKHREEK